METILKFVITLVNGTTEVQELSVPSENAREFAMQALAQYASIGILKFSEKEEKFTLVSASQIAGVEVGIPRVALATGLDAREAENASDSLRSIVPG